MYVKDPIHYFRISRKSYYYTFQLEQRLRLSGDTLRHAEYTRYTIIIKILIFFNLRLVYNGLVSNLGSTLLLSQYLLEQGVSRFHIIKTGMTQKYLLQLILLKIRNLYLTCDMT